MPLPEVSHFVARKKSWIFLNVRLGKFPQPVTRGRTQGTTWAAADILAYLNGTWEAQQEADQ
jgi:predicted DNA-binding transcriptional regulator AlpA